MKKDVMRLMAAVMILAVAGLAFGADKAKGRAVTVVKKEHVDQVAVFPQLGHSAEVNSVAFSPDGKYVLSGSLDKTLKLWEVASGREIRTFTGHTQIESVTFSPDGRYALSGSGDNTLKLWEVASGREIRTFTGHTQLVLSVAFSPDGRSALSGGYDNTLKLWEVASGREIRTLRGHSDVVRSVAFSPDGRFALSGSRDNTLKLWEVASGREIRTFTGHSSEVSSVAFSPDGRFALSGSWDKTQKLWEVANGREMRTFKGHSNYILSVAFSPDGRFALSGSIDETLKLWEVASGREIRTFAGYAGSVNSVAFSPDGKLASSGHYNGTLKLWEVASGREMRTFAGYAGSVTSVAVSPDGKSALSGSRDNTLNLWEVASGREMRTFTGHSGEVTSVVFSPDGRFALSGSYDNTLKLWEVASGREIRTFTGHSSWVKSVAFSPDARSALSGSWDKTLKLWEVASGREIRTFTWTGFFQMHAAAFSPEGRYALLGGNRDTLKLWEVASGREIQTFTGHSGEVTSVAFSPDGKLALSGSRDNTLKLWEVASGREIRTFTGHSDSVLSVAFSPDGKLALSGSSDDTLKLWDVASGREIRTFTGHSSWVTSVAFSPDGRYVVSGSLDGTVRQWDINTGNELAQLVSFTDGEWVVITPEGYYNSSENGDKHLNVRINNNVYGVDQYREAFYRPDLVKIALAGGSLKDFRNIASIQQPPRVSIVNSREKTDKDEEMITIKLIDIGGGIGDIRLYLNGSAIILDNGRGVKVVGKKDAGAVYKTYTIKLTSGLNTIRAIAFNGDNTMQSGDAVHQITATFKSMSKPSLYALVIGINEFRNPKLTLTYPVADAELFASTLKNGATGLFEKVNIKKLTTAQETTSENIRKELNAYRSLNPDDLFVFYVASHGTVDDGEYFLITSNVGSTRTEKLKADAISQTAFKELIANIPTTKKLLVIDTCSAGALGDAVQVAMLTRGMSEDTAMKVLSRAVGSTILSASTSVQEALEGYQGHGLFTFVLSEGLSGKADKSKSGYIKTTELADYVDNEVPVLAEKIFKKAQYPTISISGMGFPIGKVQ